MGAELEIGEAITGALDAIEGCLLRIHGHKPNFGDSAMRSATYVFVTVMLDKMYDLQEKEEMSLEVKTDMAMKAGEEIRALIKKWTNIDTHELYNSDGGSFAHNNK